MASASGRMSMLGRGRAIELNDQGPERLRAFSRQAARMRPHWYFHDPFNTGLRPQWFTAFSFDPADTMRLSWSGFPNATLVLPELLLRQDGGKLRLILSNPGDIANPQGLLARWMALIEGLVPPAVKSTPRPLTQPAQKNAATANWSDLARLALNEIDRGHLDKLVLYRKQTLNFDRSVSPEGLAGGLLRAFPDCRIIVMRQSGASLVSASPERLLHKQGMRIRSDVLAGTAPRSPDLKMDRKLARQLLENDKTRREHALVQQALHQALVPLCRQLQHSSTPEIRRLRNVQHLYLKLHGQLKTDCDLMQIAAQLHPTPAVNGSPAQPALEWLRTHEQAERGWYCGAAGWMDWDGNGELHVLLRCALLRGSRAELYAGAGLVSGSEPQAELDETEIKLTAVRHCLTDTCPIPA